MKWNSESVNNKFDFFHCASMTSCTVHFKTVKLSGCDADCTEFFAKQLRLELNKQIRLRQSVQLNDTKTAHASSSSSSSVTSAAESADTTLVSVFPPATHNILLPSPSILLVQLKVIVDSNSLVCLSQHNDR